MLPGEASECDWFVGQARVLKRKAKKKNKGTSVLVDLYGQGG